MRFGAHEIGTYEIGAILGKGRFGEVRLAIHSESGQRYACKIAEGDEHRKLLRQEAGMQREITACNRKEPLGDRQGLFPNFQELIEQPDKTLLIMEYIEGIPLPAWLRCGAGGTGACGSGGHLYRDAIGGRPENSA